jgi:transposase
MSNTNTNFEMTGILLGQEVRKRKTPQEKIARLKKLLAEVMLDKEALQVALGRKY